LTYIYFGHDALIGSPNLFRTISHFWLKKRADQAKIPSMNKTQLTRFELTRPAALVLIGLMLLGAVGCAGPSYRFYKATWFGKLKPGMSREAVTELIGPPAEIARRQMPDEMREVWVYHVRNLNPQNHLYPTIRLLVFSNGTMVAVDPTNPYSPDLSPRVAAVPEATPVAAP